MKIVLACIIIAFAFGCSKTKPTSLRIIVTDSNGNLVEGASVKLYGSHYDLYNDYVQIGNTVITDKNGSALFDNLQPVKYSFYAEKDCLNNQAPDFPFQIPGYTIKTLDTTNTLTAFAENWYTTTLMPTGSLKYVNYSADTIVYTWLIAGNTVVPDLTFLDEITPGDSLVFRYQPAGLYRTQINKYGNPNKSIRVDTLQCGQSLTIQLP